VVVVENYFCGVKTLPVSTFNYFHTSKPYPTRLLCFFPSRVKVTEIKFTQNQSKNQLENAKALPHQSLTEDGGANLLRCFNQKRFFFNFPNLSCH
jgi:hypothetical protein